MEKSLRNSETPDLSPPSGGLLQKKNLALLTLAHTVNDTYTGFLAPLLPIIVPTLGISLTLAGALVTTLSISTSLGQPLAGHLSDRFSKRAPSLFGLLFAGFFLSAIGIAPTYRFLLLLLILGGLGSAFFHPLAAAMTGAASGRRRGLGMAIFVAGGRVGVALGPLIAISIATLLGLKFLPLTAGLGVTMFFLLYRYGPTPRLSPQRHERRGLGEIRRVLRPLAILWVSAVLRSIVTESFVAFIPLFLYEKGHSLMAAGGAVSAFLFAGALAMMLGGHLSDLLDRRRVLLYPPLLAIPFVVLFLSGTGFLQVVALILAGMLLYSSMAVTVAFAQELMPESAGLASSLTMGMVWFTASFAVTGVGALADRIGIGSALGVTLLPLAGSALLAFFLPRRAGEVASVGNSG